MHPLEFFAPIRNGARKYWRRCRRFYELAHARGIQLPPDSVANVMAAVDGIAEDATSSMQRDMITGKPSELDSQNGAVVRMARESKVDVPIHDFIYQTLRPFEEKARATV